MDETIITNTSPLLSLSKMRAFEIIGKLPFDFICPKEVEASDKFNDLKNYVRRFYKREDVRRYYKPRSQTKCFDVWAIPN